MKKRGCSPPMVGTTTQLHDFSTRLPAIYGRSKRWAAWIRYRNNTFCRLFHGPQLVLGRCLSRPQSDPDDDQELTLFQAKADSDDRRWRGKKENLLKDNSPVRLLEVSVTCGMEGWHVWSVQSAVKRSTRTCIVLYCTVISAPHRLRLLDDHQPQFRTFLCGFAN